MSEQNKLFTRKQRTRARLFALQFLYGQEFNINSQYNKQHSEILHNLISTKKYDEEYAQKLIDGVNQNNKVLEDCITKNLANNWNIAKLDVLIKINLKLAVYELAFVFDIPVRIILDEYVNLIKKFYEHDRELGFVNAVLHKLALDLRGNEVKESVE